MFKTVPLSSGFMLISMVGFLVTTIYTAYGRISESWGFALGFLFVIMFVSSMISMTYTPISEQEALDKNLFSKETSAEKMQEKISQSKPKSKKVKRRK